MWGIIHKSSSKMCRVVFIITQIRCVGSIHKTSSKMCGVVFIITQIRYVGSVHKTSSKMCGVVFIKLLIRCDNKSESRGECLGSEKGAVHTLYTVQWFSKTKEVQINELVVYGCKSYN